MAQLSPSNLLSSTFYCLVCNKNTNNLYFNIDTTFLSKSKNVSVHTKIVQIVGNYNYNDKICMTKILCMICFKILETIDVLECELTKQKSKFKSQFRKSIETRRHDVNQQQIHSNQIRTNLDRNTLYSFNNVDDIIESVNKRSGGSSERVNDILNSFLSTSDGNSRDSSDLTSEQFISSLRTTDSPSRIHFNQNECRDDLTQPIIEKLFADDSGLNVIHDNEDTVNTITITERQTENEISVETRIENKLREILDSKESNKSNNNHSLDIITGDAHRKELKSESNESSLEINSITKRKENKKISGQDFSLPQHDVNDCEDTDDLDSRSNDALDFHSSHFNKKEKRNMINTKTKIDLKRKRKQDDEYFNKTIKIEDDWDLYTSSNSPIQKSMTDNPFFCDLCEERFSTSIELAKHREDVHSHILCHVCSDCGARYREKAKLTRHMQSQHKVNPHQCKGCEFKAKSQNGLDKHILETHPESKYFECDICNKKFSTYRYLHVVHMKRCHYGLPIKYRCNICNKGFVDKTAIENHRLTHSTIKDHTCEFCGASFRTPYSLKVHTNIHTKEIKYPCSECGANFLRNANLIAHKNRYHNSGDGKLVCETCGNSFLTKRDLQRHQDQMHPNIRDKPLTCDICHKSFYSKEKLKNHVRSHTVGLKYQCSICSQVFARKVLLQRHLSSIHYSKTKINNIKQKLIVNKNNIEQESVDKIHLKNISPTEESSVEKENVVIVVNNSEDNPLSLFNIEDHQIFGKPHNSQTLIPHTFESPQNVKDIATISGNQIETITGKRISLPTPIILNTIKDNDPLQLNNEEEITSENETINYQEYIHGVTLQSAACIPIDSENLEETSQNNFSNELLSSSQILVPESGFALIGEDVGAVEKQAASLILASKDIQNYSEQAAVLLLNQDDLDSEKSLLLTSKDIHNYSKQTPILKLASNVVSESASGPFTAIMLADQDVNSETRDSSALKLDKVINHNKEESPSTLSLATKDISNSSRQINHHFTELSIANKNICKNGASESLSVLSLPSEIVDSDSVERTLPLTLVTEDVEEKIDVKEPNISFSFSTEEEGVKEQNLVTEWF